jgi:hypothetical protein
VIRALLWKEWREQRWRFVLGTLVLTTLAASLVRAQLATMPESVVLVFGPIGLLLAIFLAMGSVATERADGTWPFLRARPVGAASVLRIKWLVGAANLAAAFLIAGAAAYVAGWSRGLFDLPAPPADLGTPFTVVLPWGNSAAWLWTLVLLSLVSMLAWYTVLFLILTRARDELHAGLGGLLLTIACLAWLLQYPESKQPGGWDPAIQQVLWISSLLNPLSPLVFVFDPLRYRLLAAGVALLLWIAGPLWLVGRLERAGRLS